MKKIVLLLALFVTAIASVSAANLVDKLWDDATSGFVYEHTVRADNKLKVNTHKNPLYYGGVVTDNGSLALGGTYILEANGCSLSIKDNGAGLAKGDTVRIVLGDTIVLGSGAGAKLVLTSENGNTIQGSASYTANGTTIQAIDLTFVGTTNGYKVRTTNAELP